MFKPNKIVKQQQQQPKIKICLIQETINKLDLRYFLTTIVSNNNNYTTATKSNH